MSAKSKETTKTAHVMNLLRKNGGGTQTADPADVKQAAPAAQSDQVTIPVKPEPAQHPIITSLNEEAAVSQEIRDALEQELMSEEQGGAEEKGVQEVSQEQEEFCQLPAAEQMEAPLQTEEELQPEEPEPEAEEPELHEQIAEEETREAVPAEAALASADTKVSVDAKEIYNVMQALVEESAEKYMTMFKLCSCPRCKADVRALALNNLQPKYVVMENGEYIPRITVYERQFNAAVTAQILRACNVVAEFPRHGDLQ